MVWLIYNIQINVFFLLAYYLHMNQSHLHHLILKKYNTKIAYFIIIGFVSLTAIISQLVMNRFVNLIQILAIILIYFSFISLQKLK